MKKTSKRTMSSFQSKSNRPTSSSLCASTLALSSSSNDIRSTNYNSSIGLNDNFILRKTKSIYNVFGDEYRSQSFVNVPARQNRVTSRKSTPTSSCSSGSSLGRAHHAYRGDKRHALLSSNKLDSDSVNKSHHSLVEDDVSSNICQPSSSNGESNSLSHQSPLKFYSKAYDLSPSIMIPLCSDALDTCQGNKKTPILDSTNSGLSYVSTGYNTSSSGCSTQSSVSSHTSFSLSRSATNSISQSNSRSSSLREQAQNFRDFVTHYEQGLMKCLSNVEIENDAHIKAPVGEEKSFFLKVDENVSDTKQEIAAQSPFCIVSSSSSLLAETGSKDKCTTGKCESTSRATMSPPSSPLLQQSLRLQLEKVRQLRDQYETGYKCSEAIEKLSKLTKSRRCDREWRANERLLVEIEQKLEALIGTFTIRVDELEGWARICPRDTYEVEFRHGKQRQVLRVRIGKALERFWDNGRCEVVFGGALKPTIVCRVREIKSRWRGVAAVWSRRTVTLGVTSISMAELLASVSSQTPIVLDVNATGSVKLRIQCSWQPNNHDQPLSTDTPRLGFRSTSMGNNQSLRSAQSLDPHTNLKNSPQISRTSNAFFYGNPRFQSPLTPQPATPECFTRDTGYNSVTHGFISASSLRSTSDKSSTLSSSSSSWSLHRRRHSNHSDKIDDNELGTNQIKRGLNRELAQSLLIIPDFDSDEPDSPSSVASSDDKSPKFNVDELPSPTNTEHQVNLTHQTTVQSNEDDGNIHIPLESNLQQKSMTLGRIRKICTMLANLQSALEDYRGQYVELTIMSIAISRLVDYYDELNNFYAQNCKKNNENMTLAQNEQDQKSLQLTKNPKTNNEVENALAEFDFLQLSDSDTDDHYDEYKDAAKQYTQHKFSKKYLQNSPTRVVHDSEYNVNHPVTDLTNNNNDTFEFIPVRHQSSNKNFETDNDDVANNNRNNFPKIVDLQSYIKSSLVDKHRPDINSTSFNKVNNVDPFINLWSSVLLLHLSSALDQLGHVGSWILKGRETYALARLRADAFAFEQIYEILSVGGKNQPLGKDQRVKELWNFMATRFLKPNEPPSRLLIVSWRQLSNMLAEFMFDIRLDSNNGNGGGGCVETRYNDYYEDSTIRFSAEWLTGLIVPFKQTKVTLFDVRAFFELGLWKTVRNSVTLSNSVNSKLSLRAMFQVALDLNRLLRKGNKISLPTFELVLFDRFHVGCQWIPSDFTLAVMALLYESHNHDRGAKPTTSEVKRWDRLREIGKVITTWLIWLLHGRRFEIRDHVLLGLESSSAITRRASCYGIMYLFKLMKRAFSEQNKEENVSSMFASSGPLAFYGQEMDCLLYVSMEDPDGRVRDEARKALKCLGHFGQLRLNQMERSRMGFVSGTGKRSVSPGGREGVSPKTPFAAIGIPTHRFTGRSMPNLNRI